MRYVSSGATLTQPRAPIPKGVAVWAMFAIVKTGGKQVSRCPGDQIVVERIGGDVGAEVFVNRRVGDQRR